MDYRKRLFSYKKVHDLEGSDPLFIEAVKKNIDFHRAHCPEYNKILACEGFNSDCLSSASDLHLIPAIPTLFLKSHELLSVPKKKMILKSTTSGTSGKPAMVGLDARTMYYGALMLRRTLSYYKLFSIIPTNYIVLGYQPSRHNKMGAVKTAFGSTFLAPALHREYALKDNGTGYNMNIEGVGEALTRYSRMNLPVRFVGFPAYFHFMLNMLRENNIRLKLHPKSTVFLGGGWKQFFAEKVDKEELYSMAEETLGIRERNIREFFAVVEHNVLYCDCANHHFHVPVYSRVVIRDPETFMPVKNGTPGLLNLITPLVGSMPLVSVVTDDIAVLHDGKECGCGIEAPYFEILGRAGMAEIKTCAVGVNELLEGVKQ